MEKIVPSALNLTTAIVCLVLAIIVLTRNRRKTTHRAFAVFSGNLSFWALGVFIVIQCKTAESARFWIIATEMTACFIPANFYRFVGYFPKGHFDGSARFLKFLYIAASVEAVLSLTPWYILEISVFSNVPPSVVYGPAYLPLMAIVVVTIIALFKNLLHKHKTTEGFEHRQVQQIMFGMFCMASLSVLLLLCSIVFKLDLMQAYGPISTMVTMSFFAYAMVRYHLLDTRVLLSHAAVVSFMTVFVLGALIGIVTFMQWAFGGSVNSEQVVSAFLASLFVVLAFQTVKRGMESITEGTLLRQRYDVNRLYTRIANQAAEELQLDRLLKTVAEDIQETIGVKTIRVLLIDETDPKKLVTEFTTVQDESLNPTRKYAYLLGYLRAHPQPILLEKILHTGPDVEMARIAQQLADLDAHFCLPLLTGNGLVGIMTLGQKESHDIYSKEELLAFHALAGPLGTAIANARLYSELDSVNLHMSNLFRQMREGVIAVDTQGKISSINDAARKLVGHVATGESYEMLPEEIAELLENTLNAEEGISGFETQIVGVNGNDLPVVMSSAKLKGPTQSTNGAVALIYDLSHVKRLEQNVLRADRLSSIGTLAAGMAHEIKNPLVSIKTFAHLLMSRYQDPDFRTTFKEVVPHEVDRIDAIVTRLLDFSRPKPVSFEPQDARAIVEGVLALVENQTRKNLITVTTKFPKEDLLMYGDDQQLHQVFLNLVLNAIDAMKDTENRSLYIEANLGHMHLLKREIPSGADTRCVQISIMDTGCGIPHSAMEDLFTPFYTTKEEGCGLGLAVVHGIIAEHGGQIDVTSSPERGTTFTVSLPLSRALHTVKTN
ncbi:MAG: PAS domain-containing protein [Candidatus Hydrogenedentes bacterium]|nr:PAS domain-containing protein [Candidatus Hydrogenedentota bacterium]